MDSYLDLEKNLYILGNDNGEIFRIINNQRELLYRNEINSEVRSIRKIRKSHLIIAFFSGDIIFLENYYDNYSIKKIRNGDNSKYDRIYALEVLNNNTIYFSSNYGKIYKMIEDDSNWGSILIKRFHGTNAIFCLEKLMKNIFITCDYGGGVVIWEVKDKKENVLYKINTFGNIQCVACSSDMNRLAMVHRTGMFLIFQKNNGNYKLILEHEYPKNSGKEIVFSENDSSFVFNTRNYLYKYSEGILYESNPNFIGNIVKVQDKIYILNSDYKIERVKNEDFSAIDKLETSKLLNIGLIGHMGVGKSTVCDKFGDIEKDSDLSSTSHRKLWIYKVEGDKFIFFNDIAGQLELIPTLLPALKRSDIILALFRSNDSLTFDILEKYIHLLRMQYKFQNRILLIRTFYDENNLNSSHSDLISTQKINDLVEKYDLEPLISIDRDNIDSLRQFKQNFLESINWDEMKDWILSIQQKTIISYLQFHLEKDLTITTLTEICNIYKEFDEKTKLMLKEIGLHGIDRSVVRTLLLRYKEMNLIDVVKLDDDLILILNSEFFRKLKAKFYENAKENMGLVDLRKVIQYFKRELENYEDKHLFKEYLVYYNKEFLSSNTWLTNKKWERIFWSLIKNETLDNTSNLIQELKETPNGFLEKFTLDLKKHLTLSQKEEKLCNLELLLELLKKRLFAEKLSKTKGYWTNKEKTLKLYYAFLDGEESTLLIYYLFSNSENHEIALSIDNFFRFYFLNWENEVTFYTRSAGFFIDNRLYESYVRNKRDFFNSNIEFQTIKYERFQDLNIDKKILLMYSIPIDGDPIRSESEILKIKELLEEIKYNREKIRILPHCSIKDLKDEFQNYIPDFIYYSGHSDENFIFFENNNGRNDHFDGLEFINLIQTTDITEIFLNSCKSKYILELKNKSNLKCIGYTRRVPDFQARPLGINFFTFFIRYGLDFYESIERSRNYIETQERISIPYIYKSEF